MGLVFVGHLRCDKCARTSEEVLLQHSIDPWGKAHVSLDELTSVPEGWFHAPVYNAYSGMRPMQTHCPTCDAKRAETAQRRQDYLDKATKDAIE